MGVTVGVDDGVSVGRGGKVTPGAGVGSVGVDVGRTARELRSGVGSSAGPQPLATISVNSRISPANAGVKEPDLGRMGGIDLVMIVLA